MMKLGEELAFPVGAFRVRFESVQGSGLEVVSGLSELTQGWVLTLCINVGGVFQPVTVKTFGSCPRFINVVNTLDAIGAISIRLVPHPTSRLDIVAGVGCF